MSAGEARLIYKFNSAREHEDGDEQYFDLNARFGPKVRVRPAGWARGEHRRPMMSLGTRCVCVCVCEFVARFSTG